MPRSSLILFYGVAYSLSALHYSVVPFEEVVCAFVASTAEEKSVVSPRVLYVRVVKREKFNCSVRARKIGIAKLDCKALNYVNMEYAA